MLTVPSALPVVPTLESPYARVIAALPGDIPSCFRHQAQRAAAYLQFLDMGEPQSFGSGFEKEAQTFGDRLMETGFVLNQLGYNRMVEHNGQLSWYASSEQAYPLWVYQRRRPLVSLSTEEEGKIADYYLCYCRALGRPEENSYGVYYHFDEHVGIHKQQKPDLLGSHKGYIEREKLLDGEMVTASWRRMSSERLHPVQMKLSERDRLVMYWESLSDGEMAAIWGIFHEYGIQMRGPAQDPLLIYRNEGQWKVRARASHDASLGEGGYNITWQETLYDPEKFLRQWLAATFVYGKRPDDSHQLSFVTVELPPDEGLDEARQALTGPEIGVSLVFLPVRGYLGLWHEPHEWRL